MVFARRKERRDNPIKVFLANQFYKVYRFATEGNYDGAVCNFSIVKKNVIGNTRLNKFFLYLLSF